MRLVSPDSEAWVERSDGKALLLVDRELEALGAALTLVPLLLDPSSSCAAVDSFEVEASLLAVLLLGVGIYHAFVEASTRALLSLISLARV